MSKPKPQTEQEAPPEAASLAALDPIPPPEAEGQRRRGPLLMDKESRELLARIRRQEKLVLEHRLAESREVGRRAKELQRKLKAVQRKRLDAARHGERVRDLAPTLGLDPARPVTEVPPLEDDTLVQVEFQPIREGRSYVRILYNTQTHEHLYEVIEPRLTETERELKDFLRDTLVRTLDPKPPEGQDLESHLLDAIEEAILEHSVLIDEVSKARLIYHLLRDFLGYGPVDVLMRDPMIEDISCDGPGIPVYLFHRQYESIRTNVVYPVDRELDSFVMQLAQRSGKHISIAEPLLDATLPDTSRLQASLSKEVTTRGSTFTVRKFRADPLTPPDLVRLGAMSARMAAYFWLAMERGFSVVYAGGTASGKTTTLNAVCQFIPPQKKIVSIEDTREINLVHENWIPGLTRTGFGDHVINGKLAGTIDMYRLLEEALRQRPEYLLVGEVRGPEAQTLFQAMATGHATYSTLHADSAESAILRLVNAPINVPRVMLRTLDAFCIQAQARVNHRLVRRVKEVVEVVGMDKATLEPITRTVFSWDHAKDEHIYLGDSNMLRRIREENNLTQAQLDEDWRNRTAVIAWMVEKGIRRIHDVANVISAYYHTPDALLERVRDVRARVAMPATEFVPVATPEAAASGAQAGAPR